MNDDDSRRNPTDGSKDTPAPGGDADGGYHEGRREPVFTEFDEEYEESERDTDYASAYVEDGTEEDDYPLSDEDEPEDDDYRGSGAQEPDDEDNGEPGEDDESDERSAAWQVLTAGGSGTVARERAVRSRDTGKDDPEFDPDEFLDEQRLDLFDDDYEEGDGDYPEDDESDLEWDDEDAHGDESGQVDDGASQRAHFFPLVLVIVVLVALGLLAVGGYGVIQQRTAAEQQIRQLQAALATAASPVDVAGTREKLREMELQAEKNLANIEVLTLYNKRLTDTVAGLEKQLAAQQSLPQASTGSPKAAPVKPAATPAPAPTAATKPPAEKSKPAVVDAGAWFVNFSTYAQRGAAESWAKKLRPSTGEVIVAPIDKAGATLYRVRVVGLADRAAAARVAEQLQSAYGTSPLWVGSE